MLCLDIFTLALLAPAVTSSALHPSRRQSGLSGFIQSESTASLQGVLNNIGANGTGAAGASSGIVVASPSKSNPDCQSPRIRIYFHLLTLIRLLYLDTGCGFDPQHARRPFYRG